MKFAPLTIAVLLCASALAFSKQVHFKPGDAQPVRLHRGDTLIIDLNTVSDGGYGWDIVGTPKIHLRFLGKSIRVNDGGKPNKAHHHIMGQPTISEFKFRARSHGRSSFTLIYGRPWELKKGAKPTRSVDVRVSVR